MSSQSGIQTLERRLLTPSDLEHFIEEAGIDARLVTPDIETPTVSAAASALGVSTGQIIKTLLFLARDEPFLVIASGNALVDRRLLAGRFAVGRKQIKLASPETVLAVTGYPVGGVPPFGHLTRVPVLLDLAVRSWDVVYGGGGDHHTLLRLAPQELARVVEPEWVELGQAGDVTEQA